MKKFSSFLLALMASVSLWATEGALSGRFTINANGDQVVFSQGNLQYFCSTTAPEWRFAEHQYDYVPFDMSAYAANSKKWIDLFAHGTSGYDNGQTNYQPYVVGADPNTYYQGNLTGNAEWGYNAISNGGNTENFGWRTPTRDEWIYLFSGRTNAASKYGHGSINGGHGMILLPDEWTTPDGLSFTPGNSVWQNAYTIEQWSLMEEAGAVFLPASGSCNNVGIPSESLQNQNGFYRASTAAYYVYFGESRLDICAMSFYQYGDAVRLVQAAPSEPVDPDVPQQDEDGYYLLGSVQDLNYFAELVNSGSVNINARMTADIDLEGSEANQWTPIGNSTYKYNGVFDGQGHVVKNLYYKYAGIAGVGFIGVGSSGAYIKNLRVEGYVDNSKGSGTGSGEAQTCAGGIMGASEEATILNCSFSGSVISYSGVAGIVGCNTALIINCYNEGEVIFHATSGQGGSGIHGTYDGYHHQQVINSYNVGSVINNGYSTSYMGSISCSGTISNCYSRENCCQNGNGASWTNTGNYGTAMSLSDMKTEDFVATLNGNVAALKSTYPDISEWVLDPITNLPIQAIFASADPGPATSIDSVTGNPSPVALKVLRNGQILILRGDKTYTLTGQKVQ